MGKEGLLRIARGEERPGRHPKSLVVREPSSVSCVRKRRMLARCWRPMLRQHLRLLSIAAIACVACQLVFVCLWPGPLPQFLWRAPVFLCAMSATLTPLATAMMFVHPIQCPLNERTSRTRPAHRRELESLRVRRLGPTGRLLELRYVRANRQRRFWLVMRDAEDECAILAIGERIVAGRRRRSASWL